MILFICLYTTAPENLTRPTAALHYAQTLRDPQLAILAALIIDRRSTASTKETIGEVPEADWVYKDNDNGLRDIEITEKIVSEKLDRLRDDKAAGVQDQIICSLDF